MPQGRWDLQHREHVLNTVKRVERQDLDPADRGMHMLWQGGDGSNRRSYGLDVDMGSSRENSADWNSYIWLGGTGASRVCVLARCLPGRD